jgi:transcriptional regulator with XRE-family HTH domain
VSHEQEPHWAHGAYIRERRLALGLPQQQLARAARITAAMVNRIEWGKRRGTPPLLRQVAAALGVPASELLERAGYADEAAYWREQEGGTERVDPLTSLEAAVRQLPRDSAVQSAVLTLAAALSRPHEQEFRRRFDQAAAGARDVDGLRAALFGPAPSG